MTVFDARKLIGELTVTLDVDVLVGAYADRNGPPGDPAAVLGTLGAHGIRAGAVASLRAALFDMRTGNDEILALAHPDATSTRDTPTPTLSSASPPPGTSLTSASRPQDTSSHPGATPHPGTPTPSGTVPHTGDTSAVGPEATADSANLGAASPGAGVPGAGVLSAGAVVPVGTVDLRDPIGAVREMERLVPLGVRAIRLFPDEQGVEAGFPSVLHVARKAAELGLTVLTGGDVRRFWQPFTGLEAKVVFLDTHFYHLGDFLVIAADEPGFHTSTRLLNNPDALETVPPDRLLYGSRTPHYEPVVSLLRLATSGLKPEEIAAVAGGNAMRLLGTAASGGTRSNG